MNILKQKILLICFLTVLILTVVYIFFYQRLKENESSNLLNKNMKILSLEFENNERIPKKYTCDGENINPPLEFSGVPEKAKSLVLIVDDPDAPRGTWTHWTLWNIDPDTKEIKENSVPTNAVEGITSFGKTGYGGPCPPSGTHRYFFKVYVLDIKLNISSETGIEKLEKAMKGHVLDSTEIIGLYSR